MLARKFNFQKVARWLCVVSQNQLEKTCIVGLGKLPSVTVSVFMDQRDRFRKGLEYPDYVAASNSMRSKDRKWVAVGGGNECVQLLGFKGWFFQTEDVHCVSGLGWGPEKWGEIFSVDLLPAVSARNQSSGLNRFSVQYLLYNPFGNAPGT